MKIAFCILAVLSLAACSHTSHHQQSSLKDAQVECHVATNDVLLKLVDAEPARTKADLLIQIQPDDTTIISHYLRSMNQRQHIEYGAMSYAEFVDFLKPHPENMSFEVNSGSEIISEKFFDKLLGAITNHGFSSIDASVKIGTENIKVISKTNSTQAIEEYGQTVSGTIHYSTNTLAYVPIELRLRIPNSPAQEVISDENDFFRFDDVANGTYMLSLPAHQGTYPVGVFIDVKDQDISKDIYALKRVPHVTPAERSIIQFNKVTFCWSTVDETESSTLWFRTGNEPNIGATFLTIPGIPTNSYPMNVSFTNGTFWWGVDLFDAESNHVGFAHPS